MKNTYNCGDNRGYSEEQETTQDAATLAIQRVDAEHAEGSID